MDDLKNLFDSYTEYMEQAAAELESLRGVLSPDEQAIYGVKPLEFHSFCEFWAQVCRDASLKSRWLRKLEHGFAYEKERIGRLVDELFRPPQLSSKDAA